MSRRVGQLPGAVAAHLPRATRVSPRLLRFASAFSAALLGGIIVVATFGPAVVPPSSVGWMLAGPLGPDPVQYLLGWTYFARSPWTLPPGLNPDFGIELGTSVFYADAIPLLAFLFKALRPFVEVPQYWGLWLLACGIAQALLGWRLLGLITQDGAARAAFGALMALQPMLLTRMGGHLALAGQWVVLAALLLCLAPGRPRLRGAAWAGLLLLTSLIHSYLLVMVAALWGADWLSRARDVLAGRDRALQLGLEALAAPASALAGLWAAGFFVLRQGFGAPGYGEMGMDLLGVLNGAGWSLLMDELPHIPHGESGGLYLGFGGLMLLAGGAHAWATSEQRLALPLLRRHWPLLLALFGMLGFAVTHRPAALGEQVTLFALPRWAEGLASALRASERFAWPLAYAALTGSAIALVRRWGGAQAGLVLGMIVVVQAVDLAPGIAVIRGYIQAEPREGRVLTPGPFWAEAGTRYARVRAVPAANRGEGWEPVARFAAAHGLPTDAVYLARVDEAAAEALRARTWDELATGRYEPGTLYVLRDADTRHIAEAAMDPACDLLQEVDGLVVLAPGWRCHGRPPR